MKELAALDIHFLVKELNVLLDGKVDKIFQPQKRELLFRFHVPGKGKHMLRVMLPHHVFLTLFKEEMKEPKGFCMFLRRRLSGARVREISQPGFERIIKMLFETKEASYVLFIELFSKGNVILCDDELNIISPLDSQRWKERTIAKGEKYDIPLRPNDPFKISKQELSDLISKAGKPIVKTLAVDLSLGGKYAEELCARAGIDKHLKEAIDIDTLYSALRVILDSDIDARTYETDVSPIPLKTYPEGRKVSSFSEAIDSSLTKEVISRDKDDSHDKEVRRIQKIIDKQEEQIDAMQDSVTENQQKAELIYANYQEIQDIFSQLQQARKKMSWKEIKEKLKNPRIVSIDEKSKKITLELG